MAVAMALILLVFTALPAVQASMAPLGGLTGSGFQMNPNDGSLGMMSVERAPLDAPLLTDGTRAITRDSLDDNVNSVMNLLMGAQGSPERNAIHSTINRQVDQRVHHSHTHNTLPGVVDLLAMSERDVGNVHQNYQYSYENEHSNEEYGYGYEYEHHDTHHHASHHAPVHHSSRSRHHHAAASHHAPSHHQHHDNEVSGGAFVQEDEAPEPVHHAHAHHSAPAHHTASHHSAPAHHSSSTHHESHSSSSSHHSSPSHHSATTHHTTTTTPHRASKPRPHHSSGPAVADVIEELQVDGGESSAAPAKPVAHKPSTSSNRAPHPDPHLRDRIRKSLKVLKGGKKVVKRQAPAPKKEEDEDDIPRDEFGLKKDCHWIQMDFTQNSDNCNQCMTVADAYFRGEEICVCYKDKAGAPMRTKCNEMTQKFKDNEDHIRELAVENQWNEYYKSYGLCENYGHCGV